MMRGHNNKRLALSACCCCVVRRAMSLSSRGVDALGLTGTATATRRAMAEARAAGTAPEWISLAIAENRLMGDILEPKLRSVAADCFLKGVHYAESWLGQPGLRSALAEAYSDLVLQETRLEARDVAVTASATSAIDLLLFALCEEGDVVMTPAPYYGSYRRDVEGRARCRLVGVEGFSRRGATPTVAELEEAMMSMAMRHTPPKVLLVSNPQNPLGTVASREELREVASLCERHDVELIVDEVFALSVFDDADADASEDFEFTSILDVTDKRAHVVYSASKDLALSGFRLGCVFSRNEELVKVLEATSVFANAGVPCQLAVQALLEDRRWLEDLWVPQLRSRLRGAWTSAQAELDKRGLKVAQTPRAGHFCLLDLYDDEESSKQNDTNAPSLDADLARRCFEGGVLLTPGSPNMGCLRHPGLFRLCYASEDKATVAEGIRRIAVATS